MPDTHLRTIAMRYMQAHKQLQQTYSQAYSLFPGTSLDTQTAEDVWADLFEALNWLDALLLRPEAEARMELHLRRGLQFVRGRVHHKFADAIEYRRDVSHPTGPTATAAMFSGHLLVADWCWRDAADLLGGKRSSNAASRHQSGQTDYENLLAGKQVRAALDQIASLAAELFVEQLE